MPQHSIILEDPSERFRLVPPSAKDDGVVACSQPHTPNNASISALSARTYDTSRILYSPRNESRRSTSIYNSRMTTEAINLVGSAVISNRRAIATGALYLVLHVFEDRKMHRTTFETGADNVPMQRWLDKVGARLEATRKEAWKNLDGSYTDVKGYATLETRWRDHVKGQLESRLARHT